MKYYFRIILLSLIVAHCIKFAQAVPPPDFIFNIGRQVVQVFTILVLGLSISMTFIKQFFQTNPFYNRHKMAVWVLVGLLVVTVSYIGADRYGAYKQAKEYAKWLEESSKHNVPLSTDSVQTTPQAPTPPAATSYFEQSSSTPENISNEDFQKVAGGAYVLDAREDEEYENGRYPGSHHIRFADIVEGKWSELPTNQAVYVLCWSGIRGKEVTDFLRSKKILARFLEKGADGWVNYGGQWDGAIKFRSVYTDKRYEIVFSTQEVKDYVQQGIVLVDSRPKEKYDKKHIPGSVSIPIIYTPISQIEKAFNQVSPGSTIITVCDDFVSCFDATIVGAKFQKRGNTFLGRYNKPWDY